MTRAQCGLMTKTTGQWWAKISGSKSMRDMNLELAPGILHFECRSGYWYKLIWDNSRRRTTVKVPSLLLYLGYGIARK